ncbi:MAG: peptide deformylase [Erysipelotrichaceae bacterium]|nr:peptide deformylase [Erysipelotrichaceae bacterium]
MYLSKDIVKEGNQILKNISTRVNLPLSSDDLECAKGLYEYVIVSAIDELVKKYGIRPGVGIAAPQVGINKRMFAINCTDFLDEKQTKYAYLFINPTILSKSKEMVYLPGGEGCLSVDRPTDNLVTPRHFQIVIKSAIYDFQTNKIKNIKMTLTGYPAIVFQHEYDHLDGILYTDKMYSLKDITCDPLYTIDEDEDEEIDE